MNLAADDISAPDNVIAFPSEAVSQSDNLVRVEPGLYVVTYVRHVRAMLFGKAKKSIPKVRIDFRLAAHPDLIVPRWYRVHSHERGRIMAGTRSDIVRELQAALGKRIRTDLIQLSITELKGKYITVVIRDTKTDARQRKLAAINYYSVIDELTAIPAQ